MSNQLQISGAAKIRSIQGPVVANSGVISALDGDASQYVRGDGTLADFPTSTGGGSSVSYYLNTSVSQGTIGGVAYKQLSKVPISGAGTDVTISANGYIASYITDANDPALLEVPAGNFNCEFYFSVNSNAHNPYVYAELYKYDGTTFTLLGSNQAIPEYLTNGTTLSAYYFAIPVATAALTITDRLSIRIYVNVDGRTVTLHTENNHLCQVVTTFSKGLTTLNSLTRQVQFFQTGTSGSDFNISSVTATHTFNIPDASASARGLITTGTQTIGGAKTFTNINTFNNGLSLKGGFYPVPIAGDTGLAGSGSGLSIISKVGSTVYTNNLDFGNSSNSYAFPNASGTIALTSSLSSYVPYTGATADVNLGTFSITGGIGTFTNGVLNGNGTNPANLYLKKGSSPFFTNAANYGLIAAVSSSFILISDVDGTNYKYASFNLGSLTNNTNRAYTLPDASGTIALLSANQTFTGENYFSLVTMFDQSVNYKTGGVLVGVSGYISQGYDKTGTGASSTLSMKIADGNSVKNISLDFVGSPVSTPYTYTFPDFSGTVALTSQLGSYLPLAGGIMTGSLLLNNNIPIQGQLFGTSSYATMMIMSPSNKILIDGVGLGVIFGSTIGQGAYTYNFPSASGTLALTSQLTSGTVTSVSALTLGTSGTDLSSSVANSTTTPVITLNVPTASATNRGALSSADWTTFNNKASTASLANYLLLTGGTLTGQLYINPTNTGTVGLDVASNNTRFRSDNLEGFKRQLVMTMGSGTLIQLTASGFGGTYGTDLAFYTSSASGVNGSPAMYITGGNNIGIGTGSPAATFDVVGTGYFSSDFTVNGILNNRGAADNVTEQNYYRNGTYEYGVQKVAGRGVDLFFTGPDSNFNIAQRTTYGTVGGNVRFTVASGGNVGIGTITPSDTLHLERTGASVYNSTRYTNPNSGANFFVGIGGSAVPNSNLQNNAYIYNVGNTAIVIATNDLERMRITASGRVGIGTSSPQSTSLDILGQSSEANSFGILTLRNSSDNSLCFGAFGTSYAWIQSTIVSSGAFPSLALNPRGGNVGVGTTSPSYKLHVTNNANGFISRFTGGTSGDVNIGLFANFGLGFGSIGTESNHAFNIFTNGFDRLAISNGGDISFNGGSGSAGNSTATPKNFRFNNDYSSGATDASLKLYLFNLGSTIQGFTSGPSFDLQYHTSGNNTLGAHAFFVGNSLVMKVQGTAGLVTISTLGSGAVTATGGVLSTTSDMNLKISDGYIDSALDKILKLTPRYFYWKEESGLPTDLRQLGFYAQEVNEAIGEEGANTPKKENEKWGIYDRAIIAMLTKGMQEQQAIITLLQEQINELKNK
jgi:hypothetical protein